MKTRILVLILTLFMLSSWSGCDKDIALYAWEDVHLNFENCTGRYYAHGRYPSDEYIVMYVMCTPTNPSYIDVYDRDQCFGVTVSCVDGTSWGPARYQFLRNWNYTWGPCPVLVRITYQTGKIVRC